MLGVGAESKGEKLGLGARLRYDGTVLPGHGMVHGGALELVMNAY